MDCVGKLGIIFFDVIVESSLPGIREREAELYYYSYGLVWNLACFLKGDAIMLVNREQEVIDLVHKDRVVKRNH